MAIVIRFSGVLCDLLLLFRFIYILLVVKAIIEGIDSRGGLFRGTRCGRLHSGRGVVVLVVVVVGIVSDRGIVIIIIIIIIVIIIIMLTVNILIVIDRRFGGGCGSGGGGGCSVRRR